MDTILFVAAGATISFCVGVLVGAGLHTRSVERRYRRLAQLVEYFNEVNSVMEGEPVEYWADPVYDYGPPRVLPPRT